MRRNDQRFVLAVLISLAGSTAFAVNSELTPLFRSRTGDFSADSIRTVSVPAPAGWHRVGLVNQDPLSLAQWTPNDFKCSTGAASRLSVYAVDVGASGPNKLMQSWFPDALKFSVGEAERGFIIVRAEAEPGRPIAVVAYPLSSEHITPLGGAMTGVNVLLVAESTSFPIDKLEDVVRTAIRNEVTVKNPAQTDVPFVLFGTEWNKALAEKLDAGAEHGRPLALVSKAYALFKAAAGYVPLGQELLLKAANRGHAQAKLDIVRLSRRSLLTVEVEDAKLKEWATELANAGAEDARFWATEHRPYDEEDAKIPRLDSLKKLATCGQPEARRTWAKHLVQSFSAKDRLAGRAIVMSMMREPPLEGTLPITTRVPRGLEAPAVEALKAAALLKTGCPGQDDPEQDLFASKADFKIAPPQAVAAETEKTDAADPEEKRFPELAVAIKLDKMVNSGNMKTLKEAQKLACTWAGTDDDRNRLVIEIAARHDDGFGKWRRFDACRSIQENNLAMICRDRKLRRNEASAESRYRDVLVSAPEGARNAVADLRAKATAFQDLLFGKSLAEAKTVTDRVELDRLRHQMQMESLDLIAVTLNGHLQDQIRDVVTGRRLMMLPVTGEEAAFALRRQPASANFMKKELERLEMRMQETLRSVQDADREDIPKAIKTSLLASVEAWKAYRLSYQRLIAKLGETGSIADSTQAAANLWFHIEGIYYLELIRDREIAQPRATGST